MSKEINEAFRYKDQEEDDVYLSKELLERYKERLLSWRRRLIKQMSEEQGILSEVITSSDENNEPGNQALIHREIAYVDSNRYLIAEINAALERIAKGNYGICEITEELIDLKRLDVWPIARNNIYIQERLERELKKKPK